MLQSLRNIVDHRWFAIFDFALVITSGAIMYLEPDYSGWPLLIALLPWFLRLAVLRFPFKRSTFDLLILFFLFTAGIGWWAAYDREAASQKFWWIVCAVLFYYALAGQPKKNWLLLSAVFFSFSVIIAAFFLLGHDFQEQPAKYEIINQVGLSWSEIRPSLSVPTFSQDDVSGLILITVGFGVYLGIRALQVKQHILLVPIVVGLLIIASSLILATSRGAWFAIPSALGVIVLYIFFRKIIHFDHPSDRRLFLGAVFVYSILVTVALLFLLSIFVSGGDPESIASPRSGTRHELFQSAIYLIQDYPFTGGGLESFSGLYTRYILGIQPFYLNSSHNIYLDIAVEQGILGGLTFTCVLFFGIWMLLRYLAVEPKAAFSESIFLGLVLTFNLYVIVFHGMVDDYLYRGLGTFLIFFSPGFAVSVCADSGSDNLPVRNNKRVLPIYFVYASSIIVSLVLVIFNLNALRAAWYANQGAVSMSRGELTNYPNELNVDPTQPSFQESEKLFEESLSFDPKNFTALYRLGVIHFYKDDFPATTYYMNQAWPQVPNHRVVRKYLGYANAWQTNYENAAIQLSTIPEALYELELYTWWWETQGRIDLSTRSAYIADLIRTNQAK
jgi:O-antigen ligase